MPAVNVNDLNNAKLDCDTIAAAATSQAPTVTDRLGNTKNTLAGMNLAVLASAAAVQGSIGYLPPVAYSAGIGLTLAAQTVGYSGQTYAPLLSALPFTTSGTFEIAKFRLIQGVSGADLAASTGSGLIGWVQAATGAVFRWVRDKLRETISVKDFGAVGDGVTDDSVAIGKAIAWVSTPVFGIMIRSLLWPAGKYLVTQNNWIGANLLTASYGGLLDTVFTGQGRNSSVILFKPTAPNAACYDQSLTPDTPLIGFTFNDLGMVFDNSANGSAPIHWIKSVAVPNRASQNFKLSNATMTGVNGSVLFILAGTVNEDMILGHNVRLVGFKSVIECASNVEALLHNFYHLDLIHMTGDAFNYTKGGSLAVYGCNAIMTGTDGVDTAVLRIGGGVTSQTYAFHSLRTELRGARTRALIIGTAAENTITFDSSSLFANIPNGQAWALAPVQHHCSITFTNCILPVRTGVGHTGAFLLTDSTDGFDYAQNNYARSLIAFNRCNQDGSRLVEQEGWVDFSALTAPYGNFRTSMVSYTGCGPVADSVVYASAYRQGRTFVQKSPPKLIFRGIVFPGSNGASAVAAPGDLNAIIPWNNFVTEIVVMRSGMATGATPYQIEFVDTAERTTPGSGVIFGATTAKANNLPIFERVPIVRQFSGTLAQRTVWARMKAGYALGESVGTPIEGGIYAEVL